MLFDVIDAVHDLKEGTGDPDSFMHQARAALTNGNAGVVEQTGDWVAKVAVQIPSVAALWDELATHPSWKLRWYVACRLYWHIPEEQSDRLFSILRHDRSKKVREMAVSRYEWRTDNENTFVKMFDAGGFDERVRSGEVQPLRPAAAVKAG